MKRKLLSSVVPVTEKPKAPSQKAAVTAVADEEYDEDEVNRVISEDSQSQRFAATAKPAEENRPVIAKYKVTSKANFYNSPDENSMRGTFISGDANKTVGALEEKNGFIFVVYTNDLGFTSKRLVEQERFDERIRNIFEYVTRFSGFFVGQQPT